MGTVLQWEKDVW